jgi:hypothetical protein
MSKKWTAAVVGTALVAAVAASAGTATALDTPASAQRILRASVDTVPDRASSDQGLGALGDLLKSVNCLTEAAQAKPGAADAKVLGDKYAALEAAATRLQSALPKHGAASQSGPGAQAHQAAQHDQPADQHRPGQSRGDESSGQYGQPAQTYQQQEHSGHQERPGRPEQAEESHQGKEQGRPGKEQYEGSEQGEHGQSDQGGGYGGQAQGQLPYLEQEEQGRPGKEEYGQSGKEEYGSAGKQQQGQAGKEEYGQSGKEEYGSAGKQQQGQAGKEEYGQSEKEEYGSAGKGEQGLTEHGQPEQAGQDEAAVAEESGSHSLSGRPGKQSEQATDQHRPGGLDESAEQVRPHWAEGKPSGGARAAAASRLTLEKSIAKLLKDARKLVDTASAEHADADSVKSAATAVTSDTRDVVNVVMHCLSGA